MKFITHLIACACCVLDYPHFEDYMSGMQYEPCDLYSARVWYSVGWVVLVIVFPFCLFQEKILTKLLSRMEGKLRRK